MDVNFSKSISMGLPPQIKNSRNSIIEVVLLLLVGGLFVWFIVLPKQAEIDAKKTDLDKVTTEEQAIAGKLKSLKNAIQKMNDHPEQISELDQALPLEGKVIRLQALIYALANSAGVTIGDIAVSAPGDSVVAGNKALLSNPFGADRTLHKFSGSAYVLGDFTHLKNFLQKLETSGRLLDVTDLSVDGGQDGNLNLRISISAYYLAP